MPFQKSTSIIYANEADVLNIAIFGKTAKQNGDYTNEIIGRKITIKKLENEY